MFTDMQAKQIIANEYKTSVWWDIENFHLPKNSSDKCINKYIRKSLSDVMLSGPFSIRAVACSGDAYPATEIRNALRRDGVTLHEIPVDDPSWRKKDAADDVLKRAILRWTRRHPPPANILLVSGDGGFSTLLEESRCGGYMVLLASRDVDSGSMKLQSSASVIWEWQDFASGKEPKRMDPLKTKMIQDPAVISAISEFSAFGISRSIESY